MPTIKVILYNVHCVPLIGCAPSRMQRVAQYLQWLAHGSDADVIVLTEAFFGRVHSMVLAALHRLSPHWRITAQPAHAARRRAYGSGVAVAWRADRVERDGPMHMTVFRNCCQLDCLANKGAVQLPFRSRDHRFHLIGTHLQAWQAPVVCSGVREQQVGQLADFCDGLQRDGVCGAGEPLLIAGDFNVPPSTTICDQLDALYVPCAGQRRTHRDGELDHAYVRSSGAEVRGQSEVVVAPGQNPSDHEAVLITIAITS